MKQERLYKLRRLNALRYVARRELILREIQLKNTDPTAIINTIAADFPHIGPPSETYVQRILDEWRRKRVLHH